MRVRPFVSLLGLVVATALVAACTTSGGAASAGSPGGLSVSDSWVRAAGTDQPTAAYLVIDNQTAAADALVGVSSPDAATCELHETMTDPSAMTGMQPVDRVEVPAGGQVRLAPGGFHVMVMGLRRPLANGDQVELDLQFEHAGRVVVRAEVRNG